MANEIYTDGACNKTTAPYGWGSVVDGTGVCLLTKHRSDVFKESKMFEFVEVKGPNKKAYTVIRVKFDGVTSQQNNGAELAAMVAGLMIATAQVGTYTTLFSDSQLLLDYWSLGTYNITNPEKVALVQECTKLRKSLGSSLVCKYVPGKLNKADLGFHKGK